MAEKTLTDKQAEQIKEQLLNQLSNFPEDKREQIKEHINALTPEQVGEFIKQNQLNNPQSDKCIFCSIVDNKTPSYKIAEDENNIAILELNPLTKAHTLVIPKNHENKPTPNFINKISAFLTQKLNAKEIKIEKAQVMNHNITNLIPIYKGETLGQRKQASKEELQELQKELTAPTEQIQKPISTNTDKQPKEKPEPIPKLLPRIP